MKKIIGMVVLMSLLAACETMQKKEAAPATSDVSTAPAATTPAAPVKAAAPEKKLGPKAQARKDAADKKAAQQAAAAEKKAAQQEAAAAPVASATPGKPQDVKGINDWSGQIIGTPVKGKFSGLKIGMGLNEVISIAGKPTDTNSHITGKAWIPFYFGSGRYETIFYYKGVGRLTFSGGAGAYAVGVNDGSGLTVIEYDKSERGFQ
ncbi:MAG: hypothetical protein V4448_03645 [Pseudomonadota bacterium]